MGLAETARLAVQIDLGGNASAGLRGLERQVKGLGASVGRVGKGFGQIGTGLFRAGAVLGAGAVAGLTGAAKAAIDFEDAFAGVVKTVDEQALREAGLSFEALAESFRGMAREMPIAATELAAIGEQAGALGVRAADIETFTRTVALLGVTTDLTSDAAGDALGKIGTILKFTSEDYKEFADSLVALGNAGASTESAIVEIAKRFAAEARAAGLAKEETLALSSVVSSLGFEPERGGTALSRVFANLATNISLANSKGKAFAQVTGRSIGDLQNAIDRGDGLTIFTDFLTGLKGLSATDAARVLKAAGITNTSDRTIFRALAENLPFVNEQLGIATEATGALSEEAQKRFNTIASKLQVLKNNVIDAGISIGEGFLPALGRAADKLSDFLDQPGNRQDLKNLGAEIGAAIDSIDWAKVMEGARQFKDVLKTALDFTLSILGALNQLPTELKAAALGFLALNKASGGLIGAGVGNIVGGLGETLVRGFASKLPKVGSLFAQPVFVTNWPMGGFGGAGAGGAAGMGAKTLLAGAALTGLAAAAVIAVQQELSSENTRLSGDLRTTLDRDITAKTDAELRTALDGVNQGIRDLQSNPLHVLVAGDALTNLQAMKVALEAELARPTNTSGGQSSQMNDPDTRQWRNDNPERLVEIKEERETNARLRALHDQANRTKDDLYSGLTDATKAALETKRETGRGASLVSATTRGVAPPIVSAIYANRPITNVSVNVSSTSITKVTTTNARYGKNTGSGGQNVVRPA